MKPITLGTLKSIQTTDWFAHVGEPASESVIRVHSWEEAINSCASEEWRNLRQDMQAKLSLTLRKVNKSTFNQWNTVVDELKLCVEPMVSTKAAAVKVPLEMEIAFKNCVKWDILHLLLEAEFSEFVRPAFYAGLAYWYTAGRFPCGWQSGKPIIY